MAANNSTNNIMKPAMTVLNGVGLPVIYFSLFLDVTTLWAVIQTRPRLTKGEFLILITNNCLCLIYKGIGVIKTSLFLNGKIALGFFFDCYIFYSLDTDILFNIMAILFFYSMYHMSSVGRGRILLKIFYWTRSTKVFLIYTSVMLGGYSVFIFTYSVVLRHQLFIKNGAIVCVRKIFNFYYILPFLSFAISFPTQLAYSFAIFFLLYSRISRSRTLSLAKLFRKNFQIMLRFFLFSAMIFLFASSRYLGPIFDYLGYSTISDLFMFWSDILFLVVFSFETFFIVLINKKLF